MDQRSLYFNNFQSPVGDLSYLHTEDCLLYLDIGSKQTPNPDKYPSVNMFEEHPFHTLIQKELKAYFSGELMQFSFPLELSGTAFQNKVWKQLLKIPFGKTISYETLAEQLGDPLCIRAAASANGKNKIPIIIPCHRVIGKDGKLVGYTGGIERKKYLLELENKFTPHPERLF